MSSINTISMLEMKLTKLDIDTSDCSSTGTEKLQQLFNKALDYIHSSKDLEKIDQVFGALKEAAQQLQNADARCKAIFSSVFEPEDTPPRNTYFQPIDQISRLTGLTREELMFSTSQESEILKVVSNLSLRERRELFDSISCFFDLSNIRNDPRGLAPLLELIKKISGTTVQKKAFFQKIIAAKFIHPLMNAAYIKLVLEFVLLVPKNEREAFFHNTSLFLHPEMQPRDILHILKQLEGINHKNLTQVCKDIGDLLKTVAKTPESESKVFLENTKACTTRELSGQDLNFVLRFLMNLNSHIRTQLCIDANPLLKEEMQGIEIARILYALSQTKPDGRHQVCVYADRAQLITKDMNAQEMTDVLCSISLIPEDLRESIFQDAIPLIKEGMSGIEIARILCALSQINPEGRYQVCIDIDRGQFVKQNMSARDILDVMDSVLWIPENLREAVFQDAKPLIKERMKGIEIARILYALTQINPQGRRPVCVYVNQHQLITSDMDEQDIIDTLYNISLIPEDVRESIFQDAIPLIKEGMSGIEIARILRALTQINPEGRHQICIDVDRGQFIKRDMSAQDILNIMGSVSGMPEDLRESIFHDAAILIKEGMKALTISRILFALSKTPTEGRRQVCVYADRARLITEDMSKEDMRDALYNMSRIPENLRESIFEDAKPLIKEGMKGIEIACILFALHGMASQGRHQVCIDVARGQFIKQGMSPQDILEIMNSVLRISENLRESIFQDAIPLIKEGMSGIEIARILCALSQINPEGRYQVCIDIDRGQFIKQGMNAKDILDVMDSILQIPENLRESIFQDAAPLIKEGMKGVEIARILYALSQIHPQGRRPVCVYANQHQLITSNMGPQDIIDTLYNISLIPEDLREAVFQDAYPIIKEGMLGPEITCILFGIFQINPEGRYQTCMDVANFGLIKSGMRYEEIRDIIQTVALIGENKRNSTLVRASPLIATYSPPQLVCGILQMTAQTDSTDLEEIWQTILSQIPNGMTGSDVRYFTECLLYLQQQDANINMYLQNKMIDFAKNPDNYHEMHRLLDFITEWGSLLQIEDAVGFFGFQTLCIMDPELKDDPNNCYNIHKMLLEKIQEPTDLSCRLDGQEYELHLNTLFAQKRQSVVFSDLPNIDKEIFIKILQKLEERFVSLSEEEQAKIEEEIKAIGSIEDRISKSYEKIKRTLSHPSEQIQRWLTLRKNPSETVPQSMVYMYALAEAAQKQSDILRDDPLTEQERFAISLGVTVDNCPTGQDEGIYACYQSLPTQDRYVPEFSSAVTSYLADLLQEEMGRIHNMLSYHTPFMEEVLPEEAFSQLTHQALYLKNLLKNDLGLEHTVTFDAHGSCIDFSLRQKSKQEILEIFLKHYSISDLTIRIYERLNEILMQDSRKSQPLYNSIIELIQSHGFSTENVFRIDDENLQEVRVHFTNVIPILISLGVLKPKVRRGIGSETAAGS